MAVITQTKCVTAGSYVRRCDEQGAKFGPIGRVVRVLDDPFEVSYIVGWPEGCAVESCLYVALVGYGWCAKQRSDVAERLHNEQVDQRSAYELGERFSTTPPAEPVRLQWNDSWFAELSQDAKLVELARPDARKRRANRLWMWQARVGVPSGKPVRGVEPPSPSLATMRYLGEESRGIVHSWSAVPSGDELLYALLCIRGSASSHKEAYREALAEARRTRLELDGETFHGISNAVSATPGCKDFDVVAARFEQTDRPDKAYVGRDEKRDIGDAYWAARDSRLEGWLLDGTVSVLESRGPKPRRAIGTLAADLAARAHELLSHVIVHDRRAVNVRKPLLVPVGAFAWRLEEKTTAKHFYPSVEKATRGVAKLQRELGKRGPVRLYTPDALQDSEYLSDAVREHRRVQRATLHRREQGKLADKLHRVNTEQITFKVTV